MNGTEIISRDRDDKDFESFDDFINHLIAIKNKIENEGKTVTTVYLAGGIGIRYTENAS